MIANLDSSIALKSSGAMNVPRLSFSLSLKVEMPFCFKLVYRWSVNFVRVSSPLKLRKTLYLHLREEEEVGNDWFKAMKEMNVQCAGLVYKSRKLQVWLKCLKKKLLKITLGSGVKCEQDRGTGNHGSNNSFTIRVGTQEALHLSRHQ